MLRKKTLDIETKIAGKSDEILLEKGFYLILHGSIFLYLLSSQIELLHFVLDYFAITLYITVFLTLCQSLYLSLSLY